MRAIGVLAGCERIEDAAEVAFLALHFVDQARGRLLFADEAGGVGFDKSHRIDGDPSGRQQDQDQECEAGRQDRQEVPSRLLFIAPYPEFATWGLRKPCLCRRAGARKLSDVQIQGYKIAQIDCYRAQSVWTQLRYSARRRVCEGARRGVPARAKGARRSASLPATGRERS